MSREKFSSIYNQNYIGGSFLRKELKGHFQFYRYNYAALSVDAAKGNFKMKDLLNDFLFAKKIISKKEYKAFYDYLREYFHSFSELADLSDEEIYGEIQKHRWNIYRGQAFSDLRELRNNNLKKCYNKSQQINDLDSLLKEIIYSDLEIEKRKMQSPINKIENLKKEILRSDKELTLIADHYTQLPFLFKLISDNLLNGKKEIEIKINLLLKKRTTVAEPDLSDWEYLNSIAKNDQLESLVQDYRFKLLSYNSYSPGIDLSELDLAVKEIFSRAVKGKSLVIGFGESLIFSLNQSNFDYYILAAVRSIRAQRYTNLYRNGSVKIPFIAAKVLVGETAALNFSGVELIDKTLYHYDYLFDKIGRHKDQSINEICPKIKFNFYSNTFLDSDLPEFEINRKNNLSNIESIKQARFKAIIENNNKLIYQSSYYDLKDFTKLDKINNLKEIEEPLIFNSILVKDPAKIELKPFLAEGTNNGIVSARQLVKKSIQPKNSAFYHNFLYFLTDKLISDYNELRKEYPLEQLNLDNIFLGYYLHNENNRKESFPLYNKGFMAYSNSGEIVFGNRRLEGGNLEINGYKISWTKEQVNSLEKNFDFIIYTPMIENESLAEKVIDFRNYKYFIGRDRLNLLLIDNKIVVVKEGELVMPSIGVVLSFAGEMKAKIKRILNLKEIKDQYYQTDEYNLNVKLDPPSEINQKEWKDIVWAYGGGTILVKNGNNLVKNRECQIEAFKNEGWFHPLSKRTQETQLQKWERGPRTVIGTTKDQRFFVATFSGRTRLSCGANFAEVVEVLKKEIKNLNWVMNLDGGASSCLALIYKKEFFELNYPAVSNCSSAGMARPVNSMLFIKKR